MAANKQAATFLSIVSFCGLIYFTLKFSFMKVFFLHSCRSLSNFVMIVFAALQYLSYLYCVQQLKSREHNISDK